MTEIEQALFHNGTAHWIRSWELSENALVLTLSPWDRPDQVTWARFEKLRLVSTDDSYADDAGELPWDILGFDAKLLPSGLWHFCLHTDAIEYGFESAWPKIDKMTNTHACQSRNRSRE